MSACARYGVMRATDEARGERSDARLDNECSIAEMSSLNVHRCLPLVLIRYTFICDERVR